MVHPFISFLANNMWPSYSPVWQASMFLFLVRGILETLSWYNCQHGWKISSWLLSISPLSSSFWQYTTETFVSGASCLNRQLYRAQPHWEALSQLPSIMPTCPKKCVAPCHTKGENALLHPVTFSHPQLAEFFRMLLALHVCKHWGDQVPVLQVLSHCIL